LTVKRRTFREIPSPQDDYYAQGTRKTCGSLLAALDVHPRVAMRILRHSKINITMEIYTETTSEATRDALRTLGDWLA
jgi:integrase